MIIKQFIVEFDESVVYYAVLTLIKAGILKIERKFIKKSIRKYYSKYTFGVD